MADQLTLADLTLLSGNAGLSGIEGGPAILRLTPNEEDSSGSAFSSDVINLTKDFTASFTFRIKDNVKNGGDGLTFSITNPDQTKLLGEPGKGLGYIGIESSIGIEFDTYYNQELDQGLGYEPNGNHISLNKNGAYGGPAGNYQLPIFDSNTAFYAWADYYASSNRLDVYVNTTNNKTTAILGYRGTVNISSEIGSESGRIGFTAATGGSASTHDILGFELTSFDSSQRPIDKITGYWQNKKIKLSGKKQVYAVLLGGDNVRSVQEITIGSVYAKEDNDNNGKGASVALDRKKRLSFKFGDYNKDGKLDLRLNFTGRSLAPYISARAEQLNIFGTYTDGTQFAMTTLASSLPTIA